MGQNIPGLDVAATDVDCGRACGVRGAPIDAAGLLAAVCAFDKQDQGVGFGAARDPCS